MEDLIGYLDEIQSQLIFAAEKSAASKAASRTLRASLVRKTIGLCLGVLKSVVTQYLQEFASNSRIVRKQQHHCENNELVELSALRNKRYVEAVEAA